MNLIHALSAYNDNTLIGVTEIPKGSVYKYEINKSTGLLKLDRVLSIQYPFDYGFIPGTLSSDGDPLDVFILSTEGIPPLTEVRLVPHAVIHMIDGGVEDEKIVATIEGASSPNIMAAVDQIVSFLTTYKPGVLVDAVSYDPEDVHGVIGDSVLEYAKSISYPNSLL